MDYCFKLTDSMQKVFFDHMERLPQANGGCMMKNESHSFQLVGWCHGTQMQPLTHTIQIQSDLAQYISVYQVGYVPSLLPTVPFDGEDDYISKAPGLFPDPLFPVKDGTFQLADSQTRALWFCVEPKEQLSGTFPIWITISDPEGQEVITLCYTLEILDEVLPELPIRNTGWFHSDCLAVLHNVPVMSEAYWEIVEKYIRVYAQFGHNMILTPILTPPLDTEVGGERPTVQLVDVSLEEGIYRFRFEKLRRWITLCQKYGIRWFEMSHLFTQWGAKCAPKVIAVVDGREQKLFGWETAADSAEYRGFLDAFLPSLCYFLRQEGVFDQCYFHISDEPNEEDAPQYQRCKELLLTYIPQERMIDALSSYSFYEKGILCQPIAATNHIQPFLDHHVETLWAYYCVGQYREVANRFMAMPSYRNRILGWQLYKYQICGFLQWGFNFWFTQYSRKAVSPFVDTSAGGAFPSGDSFLVYPLGEDGEPVCSLRLFVFRETMQDFRALTLLERLSSREEVLALLTQIEGFAVYPRSSEALLSLRAAVDRAIADRIRK